MRAGFWRSFVLALLLLCVQQLALSHVLDHVGTHVLQLEPDGDGGDCPECLALGGVQPGGAGPVATSLLPAVGSDCLVLPHDAGPVRRPLSAHAIRAPPKNGN